MVQVAIQLSDDDMQRLQAHARANATSAEAAATEAVMDMIHGNDDLLGFKDDGDYRAFVQKGIDEADRGDTQDFDLFASEIRAYMAARVAAAGE